MRNSGQALLLVVLGMAIVLTIVLSIVASTTTDIKTTTGEEESLRAFSAAEAGVEKSLITGVVTNGSFTGNSQFTVSSTTLGASNGQYIYPQEVGSLDTATVWFVSHDANGDLICNAANPCFTGRQMQVCWGKEGTSGNSATTPALEVSIIYTATPGDYATTKIARITLDPNTARIPANQFSTAVASGCTLNSQNFAFSKIIDFASSADFSPVTIPATSYNVQNGLQMAVVRLLYNTDIGQPFGVNMNFAGNSNFPIQATSIESTGTAGTSTRKIRVLKTFPDLPPVFSSVLFSPNGLTK